MLKNTREMVNENMKISVLPLILITLACYSDAIARDAKNVPLKNGMQFSLARKTLIRHGWTPRSMHLKNEYNYIGTENVLIKQGVKGIESCSVDSLNYCIINYVSHDSCLRVITTGENLKHLKVNSWSAECPPEDAL
jgi:hypothetical protein